MLACRFEQGRRPLGDLISLSAHKFHGPKGCGALYVAPGIDAPPLIYGSQQGGRRGGTPDTASSAALAAAARLALRNLSTTTKQAEIRDRFEAALQERIPGTQVIGHSVPRLPNTSCFILPGVDADRLVEALAMDGIVIASGAACTSGAPGPSHVLSAMGVAHADAKSAVRVSLSTTTRWEELEVALAHITERMFALA